LNTPCKSTGQISWPSPLSILANHAPQSVPPKSCPARHPRASQPWLQKPRQRRHSRSRPSVDAITNNGASTNADYPLHQLAHLCDSLHLEMNRACQPGDSSVQSIGRSSHLTPLPLAPWRPDLIRNTLQHVSHLLPAAQPGAHHHRAKGNSDPDSRKRRYVPERDQRRRQPGQTLPALDAAEEKQESRARNCHERRDETACDNFRTDQELFMASRFRCKRTHRVHGPTKTNTSPS